MRGNKLALHQLVGWLKLDLAAHTFPTYLGYSRRRLERPVYFLPSTQEEEARDY